MLAQSAIYMGVFDQHALQLCMLLPLIVVLVFLHFLPLPPHFWT